MTGPRPRRAVWVGVAAVVIVAVVVAIAAFVALRNRAGAPATEVAGPSAPTLPAATDPTPGTPTPGTATHVEATPTFTPDLPDLVVTSVFSRDNQLGVTVANQGAGDATGHILVGVDGGTPEPVTTKDGEPLRAGAELEYVLPSEYVQRRARVSVTVSTDPPAQEEDAQNNTLTAVVAPDLPNDLEIQTAVTSPTDSHLQVVLRNNSPIPIDGSATVTVRATDGSSRKLGERQIGFNMAKGANQIVDFYNVVGVDFTQTQVLLVTDSIDDAVPANDVYPR
jgi:hypothetical protein